MSGNEVGALFPVLRSNGEMIINTFASTVRKEVKIYIPANQQGQCWEMFDLSDSSSHSVKTKKEDAEDGGGSRRNPKFSVLSNP